MMQMDGYSLRLVSYVGERDGMALELADPDGEQVAEVFEDEATRERSVTVYAPEPVPLALMEWLIERAREKL